MLESGVSPPSRCNAGRASFVLREDFEALLHDTRAEPDQRPLEQDLVEARIVIWALEDLEAGPIPADD